MAGTKLKKAELKTKKTAQNPSDFIASIKEPQRRKDCQALSKMMAKATGDPAKMWGSSIVGFGDWTFEGKSRVVDWFKIGFSPRKAALSLYLGHGMISLKEELSKLGPHKFGMGCLYLKSLDQVDLKVLEAMIKKSLGMFKK